MISTTTIKSFIRYIIITLNHNLTSLFYLWWFHISSIESFLLCLPLVLFTIDSLTLSVGEHSVDDGQLSCFCSSTNEILSSLLFRWLMSESRTRERSFGLLLLHLFNLLREMLGASCEPLTALLTKARRRYVTLTDIVRRARKKK